MCKHAGWGDFLNAAKPGQTITFEFGEWNSFPKGFMEKIAAKSAEGVNFVFHYKFLRKWVEKEWHRGSVTQNECLLLDRWVTNGTFEAGAGISHNICKPTIIGDVIASNL